MMFNVSCNKCGTYRTKNRIYSCQYCHGAVVCYEVNDDDKVEMRCPYCGDKFYSTDSFHEHIKQEVESREGTVEEGQE